MLKWLARVFPVWSVLLLVSVLFFSVLSSVFDLGKAWK